MYYVVDTRKKFVVHQDKTESGAYQYVRNVRDLFNAKNLVVVQGAKARNEVMK